MINSSSGVKDSCISIYYMSLPAFIVSVNLFD
jgi:hypothetical protein